jgi:hypothetical protein
MVEMIRVTIATTILAIVIGYAVMAPPQLQCGPDVPYISIARWLMAGCPPWQRQ